SYTIDVYRGEVPAQRSFMKFLLFVSLYHQLVAGPIVRYSHIANEIDNRIFRLRDFSSGINRFCRGLFKKVCIANIAGSISIQFLMTDKEHTTVFGEWYGLTLFALQIYFDFSGYSDMAIGLGRMFGFHYHENFKHPYIARSIADFWRRWHISLQTFFRDYVYIPLGGNRKRAVLNIFIVWSLTGLWHGASWNFVLWGLYFGLLLFIEKKLLAGFLERAPVIIRHLYALPLILFSWSLFYFTDLGDLTSFIKTAFHTTSAALYDVKLQSSIKENMYWIPFTLILCMPVYDKIFKLIERAFKSSLLTSSLTMIFNLVLFSLSVLLLVGSSYNPFLYFRF
ncbi:MAG: MBOAT family O-acyltransferase, partial [Bacteroidota bacterium]